MHELTELLRVIIWPLTTLIIILVLRTELQRFAKNVADRIRSADTVTIGPKGIEFKGLIEVSPLPGNLQQRKVALSRFIRTVDSKLRLDAIADILNVPKSTDVQTQRNEILTEINRRVQTADDMAQLTALLKSAAGQDF
jgi:hypothetical protein